MFWEEAEQLLRELCCLIVIRSFPLRERGGSLGGLITFLFYNKNQLVIGGGEG